jgi:ribosome-associated toxin RatA of RatAB toxin-antitoxin module
MEITESIHVDAPPERAYAPLADLSTWPRILPDTLGVDILYSDGYNEEFTMTVQRPAGPETIRGIRYCRAPYELELVQTTPPPGFARMTGRWTFTPEDGGTRITAQRRFERLPSVEGEDPGPTEEQVAFTLGGLLRGNLALFREAIEHG